MTRRRLVLAAVICAALTIAVLGWLTYTREGTLTMTLPTYHVPSDAAKEFARTIDHDHDDIADYVRWTHCQHAAAFDAGCAHALATVTPRTISTAAELAALPVGQKVEDCDGDGYTKNKNGEWECYSVDHRRVWISKTLAMYAPLTLLVPATAFPEPVRPDDDPPPADHEVGALLDIAQSMARLDPATQARIARYVFERWADA